MDAPKLKILNYTPLVTKPYRPRDYSFRRGTTEDRIWRKWVVTDPIGWDVLWRSKWDYDV